MAESEIEWRDMTMMASEYEQQIHIPTGDLRHRPLKLRIGRGLFGEERGFGEWRTGPAPDTNLARNADG